MYTQCPECDTVFRVSAAVLRTARGQVRCGVCDATFDALEFLTEDVEIDLTGAAGPAAAGPTTAGPTAVASDAEPPAARGIAGRGGAEPLAGFAAMPAVAMAVAAEAAAALPDGADDGDDGDDADFELELDADTDADGVEVAVELDLEAADAPYRAAPPAAAAPTAAPATAAPTATAEPASPEPMPDLDDSIEVEMLDAGSGEEIVLETTGEDDGLADVPDSALEFDATRTHWGHVFVEDRDAPTIPPLDPDLLRARAAAGLGPATADLEFELEVLEEADRRESMARPDPSPLLDAEAIERTTAPAEDPLARTDEYPPLRLADAEAEELGLLDVHLEPAAGPEKGAAAAPVAEARLPAGVRPEDFDALVAAAAERAAAAVAATVSAPTMGTTGTVRDARLVPPAGPGPAEHAPTPRREAAVTFAATSAATTAATSAPVESDEAVARPPRGASEVEPDPAPEIIEFDARRFQAVAQRGGARAWWATGLLALGVLVLTLGLASQVVHWQRDSLAHDALLGPPLQAAYARLGMPLEPEWNLAAYDLKQWGAGSDAAPGTLRVRASVVNRAPRAQPYPWLRVTLEDRYGAKVARREFAPQEYLPSRAAPPEPLAPNARADADLLIADPGSEAVGFELDVCLRRRGALLCGEELRLAQSP